jgi:hypothetical protein
MGPTETVRTFVGAVAWGEHSTVWELLALEGRTTILKIASKRGMDDGLVERLRQGTASDGERQEFLSDLVNGLRADLVGNDLDVLEFEDDPAPAEPGRARVIVNAPLHATLGGSLPVATVDLAVEDGKWRIERLVPRVSGP